MVGFMRRNHGFGQGGKNFRQRCLTRRQRHGQGIALGLLYHLCATHGHILALAILTNVARLAQWPVASIEPPGGPSVRQRATSWLGFPGGVALLTGLSITLLSGVALAADGGPAKASEVIF